MGFLCESKKDYSSALKRYIDLCKAGGEKAFGTLVTDAGLCDPFTDGALNSIATDVMEIINQF